MMMSVLLMMSLLFFMMMLLNSGFWLLPSRFMIYYLFLLESIKKLMMTNMLSFTYIFSSIFFYILMFNLVSNMPMSVSPTLYYFYSASLSLTLWTAIMVVVFKTQLNSFIAHMMPYGAPMFLAVLLPMVEIFSQLIRPLTLMIRLSTNLSAGHIMLYMFSFFSLSSFMMSFLILNLSVMLFVLELAISALQAYIFSSLSYMYISESL